MQPWRQPVASLAQVDLEGLADAYWQHQRLTSGVRQERLDADQYRWAAEEVFRVVDEDDDPLPMLDVLAAHPQADAACFGAGPVEDLLTADPQRWDRPVAERCAASAFWRDAVAAVWLSADERRDLYELLRYLPDQR